jgi:4-hydroxy-tetrahydrodipicolinate reductase
MIKIAINGAAGRMGRRLIALATEIQEFEVAAALEHPDNPLLGHDAGATAGVHPLGVAITSTLPDSLDVLIDFSIPNATLAAIKTCVGHRIALVIGTTGLTQEHHQAIDQAATIIPILQAPNMSLGVNLLFALAAQAAQQLGDDYDIEIVEAHHRFKKDAPSGTALGIAQAICNATRKNIRQALVHGRHGDNTARKRGQIGMHALRMGDVVGRHTVTFATLGEEIQLAHNASTRDVFAHGALHAARWLVGKPPGRYSMAHVLGLPS